MIVPMMKYSFIVYHKDYERFLSELQELGVVDVTVSGWEPTEGELALMTDIAHYRSAARRMEKLRQEEEFTPREPFATGKETLHRYVQAVAEEERLNGEIERTRKEIDQLRPWGEFSKDRILKLAEQGVRIQLFTTYAKEFESRSPQWREKYGVEKIAEADGLVYFAVVSGPGSDPVEIDATEVKLPDGDWKEREKYLDSLRKELEKQEEVIARAASGYDALTEYGARLEEKLQVSKVRTTAPREAEGALVVLEGYAAEDTQERVDDFLKNEDSVYVEKEEPTEQDDPPVLLRNNRFARLFEVIGNLYSLPKYGTVDLTPYFAPFYMIFFGFCLADAGYGILYVVGSLIALAKVPDKYKGFAKLALYCGVATIFFGFISGNMFGIQLPELAVFRDYRDYFLTADNMFILAIGVGLFQILYGMTLKIIFTSRLRGFRYALGTLGWLIVILSSLAAYLLPDMGVEGYDFSALPFWVVTGAGIFLMLFMNSPGKNIFANFGLGLWDTYNNVTGLLSDALSYIRLFALGLSGGILALVFNRLAMEMAPDLPVLRQLVMILIILFGQGLTLFMASLSAFVHPLRLTFVEFYNNAGFVDGGRAFDPLRKRITNDNV